MHSSDPVDREHVRGSAHVHVVLLGKRRNIVEGANHDLAQPLIHDFLAPIVAFAILYPLEVADGHAAGIRENVGYDEYALGIQDRVGGSRGRSVRSFGNDLRLDRSGVLARYHVLEGAGCQNITLELEYLLVRDAVTGRVTIEESILLD